MKKIKIFCTLGPSSLEPNFLKFANKNIDLLRLNMSHLNINELKRSIKFVRKYTKVPICIDTEGAQIRSKVKKSKFYTKGSTINIFKNKSFFLYPKDIFKKIKNKDILDIGFEGLKIRVKKIKKEKIICKVINSGLLENNKGIHLSNRQIKLDYITDKDRYAISVGKKNKINNYALSFVNSASDIYKFKKKLDKEKKIYKLETKSAIKNLTSILKAGENFLIDRGDLSKEISIENIPLAQRNILKKSRKMKKKIFIATNFLESMIEKSYPTRAEVNDVYNAIELGAEGIVLAAETAIGKYPIECVKLIKKINRSVKN